MNLAITEQEWHALRATSYREEFDISIEKHFRPIRLSDRDMAGLQAADGDNFVRTIYDDIVKARPELANDPALLDRLYEAANEAKRIGFTDDRHIVAFLWLDSVDPGFYKRPNVAKWLTKKGAPPEQRFDMLIDAARSKVNDGSGGK
jgi:hypothetical protein